MQTPSPLPPPPSALYFIRWYFVLFCYVLIFFFLSVWDVEREKLALGGGRLRARCGGATPQPPPWAAAPFKSILGLYLSPVQTPLCECRPLIIRCQEEMGWPRAAGSLWPSFRAGDTAPTPGLCLPGPGGEPGLRVGAPDRNMALDRSPGPRLRGSEPG